MSRRYIVDYGRGLGSKPWGVYRLGVAGCARVWLADFASKAEAQEWIGGRS